MAPTTAKSLVKEFRASFRRKKDPTPKIDKAKELEDEELAKLTELKANVSENLPPRYTDAQLMAFLRARSLNVKEAEKLTSVDVNMRKFFDIDELVRSHELSDVNKDYSCSGLIGYDKKGSLVRIINVGHSDIKGYLHTVSTIESLKLLIWYLEKDLKIQDSENKKTGRKNNQIVYILNLDQANVGIVAFKPAVDSALLSLKLLQDHFHDTPKRIFIINTPAFFGALYKVMKSVIREPLQKKITILDNDCWQEELRKYIDEDTLPVYLGGNRVDSNGDEMCNEYIGYGGKIPKSYYFNDFVPEDDPDLVKACVPAGSFLNLRFPNVAIGTTLWYYIQGHENDIGVGLFLDTSNEEPVSTKEKAKKEDMSKYMQLTPIIRTQCQICPEVGTTVAWLPGTLILHLDNSYSWMVSKEISYKVIITPPTGVEKDVVNATHVTTKKK